MKKIRVLREINIDTNMFITAFDKAAKLLEKQKLILEKQGWASIHLKMVYYNEYSELCVYGMRLETDDEFSEREKIEMRKLEKAKRKLERERKKYEELKTKFND